MIFIEETVITLPVFLLQILVYYAEYGNCSVIIFHPIQKFI